MRRYQFAESEQALLQIMEDIRYTEQGTNMNITTTCTDFSWKKPTMVTTTKKRGSEILSEVKSVSYYYHTGANAGKLEMYIKPLTAAEYNDQYTREAHTVTYFYGNHGKLTTQKWYREEGFSALYDRYGYGGPGQRLSYVEKPEGVESNISYTISEGYVTKRTTVNRGTDKDETIEEYFTAATNYAYPSETRRYYTDENGENQYRKETYTYNMLLGMVESVTDNDGNVTEYEYDDAGRVTKITSPQYETYGNANQKTSLIAEQIIEYDPAWIDYSKEYPYDDRYKFVADRRFSAITYYQGSVAEGNVVSVTEQAQYLNFYGMPVREDKVDRVGTSNQVLTSYIYYHPDNGKPILTIDPLGNETTYSYDRINRLTTTIDSYGNYYKMKYDLSIGGNGEKTISYFVPADKITNGAYSESSRESISESYFDEKGILTESRAYKSYPSDYISQHYFYDIVGNLTGQIDANGSLNQNGHTVTYKYDGLNRLDYYINANDEKTGYIYDKQSNLIETYMEDSSYKKQKLFKKEYDEQGRLLIDTDPLDKSQEYIYNNLGLLDRHTDRNGTLNRFYYDEMGGISSVGAFGNSNGFELRNKVTSPYGAGTTWDIFYENKGNGYEGFVYGTISRGFSVGGKLLNRTMLYNTYTGVSDPYASYEGYFYDKLGRIEMTAFGATSHILGETFGFYTNYTYNKLRLEKVQLDGSPTKNSSDSVNAKYDYYPDGKLKSVTYPTLSNGEVLSSTYEYDGLNRLGKLTNKKGNAVVSEYRYEYDNNGNAILLEEEFEGETHIANYEYDSLNRLDSFDSTKGKGDSYTYDYRGNRETSQSDLMMAEGAEYAYDELNRLYYVKKGNDTTVMDYTAEGTRFMKAVNNQRVFYVYDANKRLVAEVEAVDYYGTEALYPTSYYIWGSDRVLSKVDNLTGKSYYYIYNGHGDVVQIVDTDGNIVNRYDYDPWGNFLLKDETIENPFTYFCQTYDDSTGLYYLRARYFDPTIGRFTQEDPARDGLNWFVYGNSNPIRYIDILGLAPGDPFSHPDLAALDFAMIYQEKSFTHDNGPDSVLIGREYGAKIYSWVDNKDGETYYSYTKPIPADDDNVYRIKIWEIEIPEGKKVAGILHTHGYGGTPVLSPNDINTHRTNGGLGYLINPLGQIIKHEVIDGEDIVTHTPFVTLANKDHVLFNHTKYQEYRDAYQSNYEYTQWFWSTHAMYNSDIDRYRVFYDALNYSVHVLDKKVGR